MLAVRGRLKDDFEFYAPNALKIRTKDGEIAPLKLKPAQKILMAAIKKQWQAERRIRIIILKARQQGLSTVVGGFLYFKTSQNKARKTMVIAHKSDSTQTLFDMTKRYHDSCPAILKPSTKYSSRKELAFDLLDSSYTVATAGGDGIARGETINFLHCSELAFWPPGTARENFNAVTQCVPNKDDTAIFIESTANGISGLFAELWKGAVDGTNGYVPVFIPWFMDPDYTEPVPENFERTPEEEELAARYDLTDGQLIFRRRKIAQNGIDLFRQEYPAEPDEAFLTTGRPVFNPEQLQELLRNAKDPIARMAYEGGEFVENKRGELACYFPHDPAETYYIGADVAMGVKGDFSVAQVMDSRKRVVATYRAQVHPDYYAEVLGALGTFYNEAKIAVESNNHGILTCTRLGKDMAYPNFYTEVQYDKITDKETVKLGFSTTVKSKPLIIDKLRAAFREREIEIHDKDTLRELLSFIVTEEGRMEAESGCHDDAVMSLAICHHINEGYFQPIANVDAWYVEMI